MVKRLKAKDTRANKLASQTVKDQTAKLYKPPAAKAFKLKEFQNVESRLKAKKNA